MNTKLLLIYTLFFGMISACSVQEKEKQKASADDELGMEQLVLEAATNNDTVVVTEQMVDRHFVRMPDTPQGYRAQAFIDVVMGSDDEQILPFLLEHYAPDFIDQVPQADHKALLRSLQKQIDMAEVASIEKLDNAYRIGVMSAMSNREYVIDVYFEPEAPYRISGIRVL